MKKFMISKNTEQVLDKQTTTLGVTLAVNAAMYGLLTVVRLLTDVESDQDTEDIEETE